MKPCALVEIELTELCCNLNWQATIFLSCTCLSLRLPKCPQLQEQLLLLQGLLVEVEGRFWAMVHKCAPPVRFGAPVQLVSGPVLWGCRLERVLQASGPRMLHTVRRMCLGSTCQP